MTCQIWDATKSKVMDVEIGCIYFNAKEKRKFVIGDSIEVILTSTGVFLTKEYIRPLLIFDMHGVLGERETYEKRSSSGKRRFVRRPYCEDFIKMCADHYELAVWSCGMKKNIDLTIFGNFNLLFAWCQDESTNLYPRTSIVSNYKVGNRCISKKIYFLPLHTCP
jgi:hypothetical protein